MFVHLLSFASKEGYNRIHMSAEKETIQFNDPNSTLILYTSSPVRLDLYDPNQNTKKQINLAIPGFTQYSNVEANITSYQPQEYRYWYLPKTFCSSALSIEADFFANFNTLPQKLSHDFCVFSQYDATALYLLLQFETQKENCTLDFYQAQSFNMLKPHYRCSPNQTCKFDFVSPFIMKTNGCDGARVQLSLNLSVARDNVKAHECQVQSIPEFSQQETGFIQKSPLGYLELACGNAADMFFYVLLIVIIIFFIFCAIVGLLCAIPPSKTSFSGKGIEIM